MMTAQQQTKSDSSTPRVLVVVPCLNEEGHIERVVTQLLTEADRVDMSIVVADGGSSDGTLAIVKRLIRRDSRIVLVDNPKRIQAAAINSAAAAYGANAKFLIRVDAHAEYPDRYCERLLTVQAETDADSVVVTMHARGYTCFQRAAAAAQNSVLGNGGSAHRNESRGRWVDHGHHALMTLDAFKAVGGYDETFAHNEDAELDARLSRMGFRIFLTGEIPIAYYPRQSPIALFLQYFNFGRGRARNFLKHGKIFKARHLVPVGVAPAIGLAALLPFSTIFLIPVLVWAILCLGYGILLSIGLRDVCTAVSGVAAMVTQAGWSFGFFAGLIPSFSEIRAESGVFPVSQQEADCPSVAPNSNESVVKMPTVSVIMANYNGATYLADAIESVRGQTLSNIEIIISDDASTDTSVDVITRKMVEDSRIRLVTSERNGGPAAARNQALAMATGDWIAIMDSDDLMAPDRLTVLVEAATRDGADIVADDAITFDTNHTG